MDSEEDSSNKRVRVVTSDGEVMYVVQGDDTPKPLIDLTLSDDEAEPAKAADESGQEKSANAGAGQSDSLSGEDLQEGTAQLTTLAEEERDIKPDLDELDRRILEAQRAMGMVDDPEAARSSGSTQAEGESLGSESASASDGENRNIQAAEESNPAATESSTEAGDSSAEQKESEGEGEGDNAEESTKAAGTEREGEEAMDTGASKGAEDAEGNAQTASTETMSEAGKESTAGSAAGQLDDVGDDDFDGDFPEDDEGDDYLRDMETPDDPERAVSRTSKDSKEGKGQEGDIEDEQKSNEVKESDEKKNDNGSETLKEGDDGKKSDVPENDTKDTKGEEKTDSIKDEKLNVKSLTNGDTACGKGPHFETKPKMSKIVKTRGVQTLPVEIKGLLTDSYNFSKLAPSEIHHLLVQRTNELEGLRKNVRELLRIILPEVDLGTPDSIDQVVQEVIQVNQTEAAAAAPPKSDSKDLPH